MIAPVKVICDHTDDVENVSNASDELLVLLRVLVVSDETRSCYSGNKGRSRQSQQMNVVSIKRCF